MVSRNVQWLALLSDRSLKTIIYWLFLEGKLRVDDGGLKFPDREMVHPNLILWVQLLFFLG